MVVLDIFGIITAAFLVFTKMCIHIHQVGSQVTPELWALSMEFASC